MANPEKVGHLVESVLTSAVSSKPTRPTDRAPSDKAIMLAFRMIAANYPYWDRPEDGDTHGWAELLKMWQLNLLGMDDNTLGAALHYHIRPSLDYEGRMYPPTPGKLWVALDMRKKSAAEADTLDAVRGRTSGNGTRRYDPKAPKAGDATVKSCMLALEKIFPKLKDRRSKCASAESK